MTTAREIVLRAMRKIGVVAHDEESDADQIASGVDALNMMIFAWELSGVDTNHVTLGASDTFPLDAKFEEGTVYCLASRLAPDYEVPQAFDADQFFRGIQAAYLSIPAATMPNALIYTPSRRARDGTIGLD